jgi:hypothetical protein
MAAARPVEKKGETGVTSEGRGVGEGDDAYVEDGPTRENIFTPIQYRIMYTIRQIRDQYMTGATLRSTGGANHWCSVAVLISTSPEISSEFCGSATCKVVIQAASVNTCEHN